MQSRTEDLLSLRDGEPLDASSRAALEADPSALHEVERLHRLQKSLSALPTFAPPPDGWQRVLAASAQADAPPKRWRRRAAGAAISVTAAAAAFAYVAWRVPGAVPQGEAPSTTVAADASHDPLAAPVTPASYVSLVEESARLERLLAAMPEQRPVMTARTAGTIAGLEDRIAFIDEQLSFGAARGGLAPPQRQTLWGERVDLMNALVHVRYPQAQQTGF
jgi:hypothetical protein